MYKTSVYTLASGNIEELAHWKQQKSAAHWHTVSVMRAISPFVTFAVFDVRVLQCCR